MKLTPLYLCGVLMASPAMSQPVAPRFASVFNAASVTPRWQGTLRAIGNWAATSKLEGAARYRFLRAIDPAHPNPDDLAIVSPFVQALIRRENNGEEMAQGLVGGEERFRLLEELDQAANEGGRVAAQVLSEVHSIAGFTPQDETEYLRKKQVQVIPIVRQLQRLSDWNLYPVAQHAIASSLNKVSDDIVSLAGELNSRQVLSAELTAPALIGDSPGILEARKFASKYGPLNVTVLITGETGSGKEVLARALHERGPRAKYPLVAVNVAAITSETPESTLFGYGPGAFTGAGRGGAPGVIKSNQGGTLLFDEIGDMPLRMQTVILRFLQDGSIQPVGGASEPLPNPPRIIAATHRDLAAMVAEGTFREDLFYRLNGASFQMPPLRDRREDILTLAEHFLEVFQREADRDLRSILSTEAQHALSEYYWPGNVRQLENIIRRAIAEASGMGIIRINHLGLPEHEKPTPHKTPPIVAPATPPAPSRQFPIWNVELDAYERTIILEALTEADGNIMKAAGLLNESRLSLQKRISQLGLSGQQEQIAALARQSPVVMRIPYSHWGESRTSLIARKEIEMLRQALAATQGNLRAAASLMQLHLLTARAKLREHGFSGFQEELIASAGAELSSGDALTLDPGSSSSRGAAVSQNSFIEPMAQLDDILRAYEIQIVLDAMKASRGKKEDAARLLDVKSGNLWKIIKDLGIKQAVDAAAPDLFAADYFRGRGRAALLRERRDEIIRAALIRSGNNLVEAARDLGIADHRMNFLSRPSDKPVVRVQRSAGPKISPKDSTH